MATELEPPDDLDVGHVMDQGTWDAVVADRDEMEAAIAVSKADPTRLADLEDPDAS